MFVCWWEVTIPALMRPNSCHNKGNRCVYCEQSKGIAHYSEIAYKTHLFQFNHFARHWKDFECTAGTWLLCSTQAHFTNASRWIDRQIGLSQWKKPPPHHPRLYCSNENNWIKFSNNFALSHKTHFNAQSHSWIYSIHKLSFALVFSFVCKLKLIAYCEEW